MKGCSATSPPRMARCIGTPCLADACQTCLRPPRSIKHRLKSHEASDKPDKVCSELSFHVDIGSEPTLLSYERLIPREEVCLRKV